MSALAPVRDADQLDWATIDAHVRTHAPGAHDMRREWRVLSRLWRHFDRAPRAYLFC